jgi:glycosyltransferase involved in cell wall biosynthesis
MARKAFFLTSGPPVPVVGARRVRDAQILSLLSKHMPIEVLCIAEQDQVPGIQAQSEKELCAGLQVSCHRLDPPSIFTKAVDIIRPEFAQGYSESLENYLRSRAQPGDLVWISRLRMAKYIAVAKKLGCHAVLDEHQIESDLLFDNAFSKVKYWHQGAAAAQCALYEKRLSYVADAVVTASSIDAARLKKLAPQSKIRVIPHGLDVSLYKNAHLDHETGSSSPRLGRILFFGDLDYRPNFHGIEWFSKEVLPRLKNALRGNLPEIVIASENGNFDELKLRFPEIRAVRYKSHEELMDLISGSAVGFFPLQYGRGNRIHLLEALAAGLPVVSSGEGVDGLVLKPLYDFHIGDTADEFTAHILRLLRHPEEHTSELQSLA